MDPKETCFSNLARKLYSGETCSVGLTKQALASARRSREINAFISLDEAPILAQAEESDRRRSQGTPLSPIDGIPVAIKDNIATREFPTTAGSQTLPNLTPGTDATIVSKLSAAGAVVFGKTNMHEWAYGATNMISAFGPTKNPLDLNHMTGGSSGGSAAAVASGIVSVALGTDTGGSVRIPAAACGTYGFKPSYGRISRHGIIPLSWSLDAPGILSSSLSGIIELLPFLFGPDAKDGATNSAPQCTPVGVASAPRLLNLVGPGLERAADVDEAVSSFLDHSNLSVDQYELPHVNRYFAAWDTILHCEATAYHYPMIQQSKSSYSPATRAHLEAGLQLTGVELLQAQIIRSDLLKHLTDTSIPWDALVLPTLPVTAPVLDSKTQKFGGREVTTQDAMTWFCWLGNLAGLPCITLPIGRSSINGLPVGMMLMGRPGRDEALLSIAKLLDARINR